MSSGIAERLAAIRERIEAAARSAGRQPEEIRLIAVSKGQSPERIREAFLAGQRDFGENYQQELMGKATALAGDNPAPIWHFQGTLQRRKIKEILKVTTSILSVARLEELEEIEKRACQAMSGGTDKVECFIEVNIAREPQKNGVLPEDLAALLDRASALRNLEIKGLMCVPPFEGDPRPWFMATRDLAHRLGLRDLSMGMSDDFEVAIAEGATMVRVGTAIFGSRG